MTARDRLALTVVLCGLLLGAAWMFVLRPQRSEAARLADDLAGARAALSDARDRVDAGRAARAGAVGDEAVLAQLGAAVPPTEGFAPLLTQVQRVAADSKTTFRTLKLASGSGSGSTPSALPAQSASGTTGASGGQGAGASNAQAIGGSSTSVAPGVVVDDSGIPTLPMDITLSGRYFDLQLMLGRLADLVQTGADGVDVRGRLLTVDSFSLDGSARGLPHMDAEVHAKAYILPEAPSATGSTGASAPVLPSTAAAASGLPQPTSQDTTR